MGAKMFAQVLGRQEAPRQKAGDERKKGGELREKRELIILGYKAQEIPPTISFTRRQKAPRQELFPMKKVQHQVMKVNSSEVAHYRFPIPDSRFPIPDSKR